MDDIAAQDKKITATINTWEKNERLAQEGATVEEIKSDDEEEEDEAPPELEQLTTEELQKEREAMTEE